MISKQLVLADSHVHLFRFGYGGDQKENAELANYEWLRQEYGIGKVLAVGYEGDEKFAGNNQYLRVISRKNSWIAPLKYVGRARPQRDAMESEFFGYSIYLPEWGDSRSGAAWLQTAAIGVRQHPIVSLNGTPESFRAARAALLGFDSCRVLVSHLGLPGSPAKTREEAISRLRPILDIARVLEIYVKISGLYTFDSSVDGRGSVRYIEVLLEEIGAERLLWGSDYAPGLDHLTVNRAFALPSAVLGSLTPSQQAMIQSENLIKILGE